MNPRFKKRMAAVRLSTVAPLSTALPSSTTMMMESSNSSFEVRNEAALLLSLSDIVNREVQQTGLQGLWHDDDDDDDIDDDNSSSSSCNNSLPKFPRLSLTVSQSFDDDDDDEDGHFKQKYKKQKLDANGGFLKPRCEELMYPSSSTTTATSSSTNLRLRTVSIDSPRLTASSVHTAPRIASPISSLSANIHANASASTSRLVVSPVTPRSPAGRSPRRSSSASGQGKSKKTQFRLVTPSSTHRPVVLATTTTTMNSCYSPQKGQDLQGPVPKNKGIHITTIHRKKFSWKNYPELETFLIANREDYLHHSALNYTIQQKQYNNHLTVQLLELATQHGYMFNVQEFSFVTVRDRIRCYYKSYVQSAKKRGVLMGYAARKAGLLSPEDCCLLEKNNNNTSISGRLILTTATNR